MAGAGYERAQRVAREAPAAVRGGALAVEWSNDSRSFEYDRAGTRFRFDVAKRQTLAVPRGSRNEVAHEHGEAELDRGRQADSALAPNGAVRAFYRDRNVWLRDRNGSNEHAGTKDGRAAARWTRVDGGW